MYLCNLVEVRVYKTYHLFSHYSFFLINDLLRVYCVLSTGWKNESHVPGFTTRGLFAVLENLDLSFRDYYSHWPWRGPRECRFEILSFLWVVSALLENIMPGNGLRQD